MRSSGSSASTALLLLLIMSSTSAAVTGSSSNDLSYEIRLLERQWTPDEGLSSIERSTLEQRAAALRLEGQERIHVLLQLRRPQELADREALARRGIELGSYVPHSAWIASIPVGRISELAGSEEVRWLAHWDAGYKLHPRIEAGEWGSWAIDSSRDGWVRLFVQLHRDVPLGRLTDLAEGVGGETSRPVVGLHGALVRVPVDQIGALATEEGVLWIEEAPLPLSATNDGVLRGMRADVLQSSPYSLEGDGVRLFVYDAGSVRDTHTTFDAGAGSRVDVLDASPVADHATHVAGTAAGDGNGGRGKGVAPEAAVLSAGVQGGWDPGELPFYDVALDIEADYVTATSPSHEADLGNNSVGSNLAQTTLPCDLEGNYGVSSQLVDGIVRSDNASIDRTVMVAWANGNERTGGSPRGRCGANYRTTAPPSCSKNPIHVGAVNSDGGSMTAFSSWGPCDDGRLKPTLVAPGCEFWGEGTVFSSLAFVPNTNPPVPSNTEFGGSCGTSMASPAVAGVMSLFLQDWRAQGHGGPTDRPLPALVKAMLIQTARDHGQPGPDYIYGYGAVDAVRLIDLLRDGGPLNRTGAPAWGEGSVGQGELHVYTLEVPPGTRELKATLAWDDEAAAPFVTDALVNDLDLEVEAPDGTVHPPWILDSDAPHAPAATGVNDLDNQEQVLVALPEAGTWTVRVRGTLVPGGSQSYGLAYDAEPLTFDPSACDGVIDNGGFEVDTSGWELNGAQRVPAPSPGHGQFSLQLGGAVDDLDRAAIEIEISADVRSEASFWWHMTTQEEAATGHGLDQFALFIVDASNNILSTVDLRSDGWQEGQWIETGHLDLSDWSGETIKLDFRALNDEQRPTTFYIDDVQIDACPEIRTLTVEKTGTGSGTVTSNPPGIDCGNDCTESYAPDTLVTLTATPSSGSAFTGWSGACSGSGTCEVTMDDHRAVSATLDLAGGTCPSASLACGGSDSRSNDGPGSTDLMDGYSCNGFNYAGPEYSYAFQSPAGAEVTVDLTGLNADLDLLVIEELSGGCVPGACVEAGTTGGSNDESVTFTAQAGETYYVVVDGFSGAVSSYDLSVDCNAFGVIFEDGFESGDLSAWSSAAP